MPTEAKRETVAELREELAKARTMIVSEYRGLKVKEIAEIRRALRKQDVTYRVVKNRLMRIAAQDTVGEALGPLLVGLMKTLRRGDLDRGIDRMGRLLRRLGPLLPEHRIGRQNLTAAFPEKSPAQIEEVLLGVWENLGQFGAEFANLDRLWDYDPSGRRLGRIEASQADADRFTRLSQSGKPVLVFAAHLAVRKQGTRRCTRFRWAEGPPRASTCPWPTTTSSSKNFARNLRRRLPSGSTWRSPRCGRSTSMDWG
jgi:hypothetical protein